MRRLFRWTNVLLAAVALASGLAVLASYVLDPGYRALYADSLVIVLAYIVFYAIVLVAFARDDRRVPGLAVAKALGAYLFVATFLFLRFLGPLWMVRTPARYLYLLFDWGCGATVVLIAFVIFGRGVWNTVNAVYFTVPWWVTLRTRRPLLGRVATMVPVALVAALVAGFVERQRHERDTYSAVACEVAEQVFATTDCAEIRAKTGTDTTDLRQRADERFRVHVRWDCRALRIYVQDAAGRFGHFAGQRLECCGDAPSPPSDAG